MLNKYTFVLFFALSLSGIHAFSQNVGINTTGSNGDASSMLDVSATDKGILIPRVSLVDINNSTAPVNMPATGLLVYNMNGAVVGGSGIGFYFWSGSIWTKMATGDFGTTLTDGRIWIGNGSNIPTEQQITGDISINNTGLSTIQADAVNSGKIFDGSVANNDLANMAALSIKGNVTNGIAGATDIVAGTDGDVLRRNGTTIGFGTLPNTSLTNSSVVVNAGTGMTGGGAVSLGGSVTLDNAGVLSLAGTTNRVNVSASTGNITLSTPQDIHTGANTIFNSVTAPNDFFGRINIEDTRSTNALPATYTNEVHFEFKSLSAIGSPGTGNYGGLMTVAPWSDASGDNNHQLFFNNGGIYYRTGTPSSTWNGWSQLLTGTQILGTTNYISKFTGANTLGNSQIYENGINIGIGATGATVPLAVGGNGSNVYNTSIWAENNIHVQGNETLDQGGRGRLRIGTAWQYIGLYSEVSSTGVANDLVLGSSSSLVRIGPAGGAQNLRVSGLEGSGNRPVSADANGTLRANENSMWTMSANFASSPDDITGYTDLVFDNEDDVLRVYNLGFNVSIEGVAYSQISVCSNGWIAFGNVGLPGGSWVNTAFPVNLTTNPIILPYWDDLKDYGSGEYIRAVTYGVAPNRVAVVYFRMREQSTATGNIVHFQVMIHETSGLINVKYFDPMAPAMNGQGATVGFQLSGGSGAKVFPLGYNAKIFDDNRDDSEGWSVSPVR